MRYQLDIDYEESHAHWFASLKDDAGNIITGEGCTLAATMMELGRSLELLFEMEDESMADEYDFTDARPADYEDNIKDMP